MRNRKHGWIFVVLWSLLYGSLAAGQQVTFQFTPAVAGMQIQQVVKTTSNLKTKYEQSHQLISLESQHTQTHQQRHITVVSAANEHAATVHVHYERATTKNRSHLFRREKPQCVNKKSYEVSRIGDELQVRYLDGRTPPQDEIDLVSINMQSIGRTNPVATFLRGRTVTVGEQLLLPSELAAELLNTKVIRRAQRVTMTLKQVDKTVNPPSAIFDLHIGNDVVPQEPQQTASPELAPIISRGTVVIDPQTCRTQSIHMQAELNVHEERGPQGFTFDVSNEGELKVESFATYRLP